LTISEKDLYKFVFYPDKLSSELFEYITKNIEKFQEQIQLLTDLKHSANEDLHDKEIVSKIYDKIAEFENSKNIELNLVNVSNDADVDYLTPDVDTWSTESNTQVKTFADKLSRYIAKVISSTYQTSILVFNKDFIELKDLEITIYPTKESFVIENSSEPLVLEPKRSIESLSLNLTKD
jgi:hypothetical protein